MKYYVFGWDYDRSVSASYPRDECDVEIRDCEGRQTPWEVAKGFSVVPYYDEERDITSAKKLPDYLVVGVNLLLSEKARGILDEMRLGPELGSLPVEIRNRAGKYLADFSMVYSREKYQPLDLEQSEIEYYTDKQLMPPAGVFRWVFLPDRIPDVDLFYTVENRWICTWNLRKSFHSARVRGVKFYPVWSHEEGPLGHDPWARRIPPGIRKRASRQSR